MYGTSTHPLHNTYHANNSSVLLINQDLSTTDTQARNGQDVVQEGLIDCDV